MVKKKLEEYYNQFIFPLIFAEKIILILFNTKLIENININIVNLKDLKGLNFNMINPGPNEVFKNSIEKLKESKCSVF